MAHRKGTLQHRVELDEVVFPQTVRGAVGPVSA